MSSRIRVRHFNSAGVDEDCGVAFAAQDALRQKLDFASVARSVNGEVGYGHPAEASAQVLHDLQACGKRRA